MVETVIKDIDINLFMTSVDSKKITKTKMYIFIRTITEIEKSLKYNSNNRKIINIIYVI